MNPFALAAIDCGTNSTRLLVVDRQGDPVVREMRLTRLGQGVDEGRVLRQEAVERTLGVLADYRKLMDGADVGRARLVATSAVRDAANGDEFLRAASELIGVEAELLSGRDEGRLSYAGATGDLPPGPGQVVVLDIGGGSTETVTSVGDDIEAVSMDIGCVRLTERMLRDDPPGPEQVAAAVRLIDDELVRAERTVGVLSEKRADTVLVGLAGTVSTLMALELGLVEYDRDRIHHGVLQIDAVRKWCDVLGRETAAERAVRPAIATGREDVIFGGALVLREFMERFELRRCIVSEADILDGLVMSILPAQGP